MAILQTQIHRLLYATCILRSLPLAFSFGTDIITAFPPILHDAPTAISSLHHDLPTTILASSPVSFLKNGGSDLLSQYKQSLINHPLGTKMATGGFLAVMGDAIAQSRTGDEEDNEYDIRRAASFMVFDMCYRALQHVSFPIIVRECQGQYFGGVLKTLSPLSSAISDAATTTTVQSGHDVTYYLAAMEQTLASQLGIVPFIYYPVFFGLTGFIQGLTASQALDRAKETFVPLMKRNLLFWIPVQFVQFGFVEEGLQIPFLSVCGLCWTFILSVMAGSTKSYGSSSDVEPEQHDITNYCVTGTEPNCEIDPDHLLPGIFEDNDSPKNVNENNVEEIEKEEVNEDELVLR